MASSGSLTLLEVYRLCQNQDRIQCCYCLTTVFVVVVGGGLIPIQGDLPIKLIVVSFSGCCTQDMDICVSFDIGWLSYLHVVVTGLLL